MISCEAQPSYLPLFGKIKFSFFGSTSLAAFWMTASWVKPYSFMITFPGAEAPNWSTPTVAIPFPRYGRHPRVTPASIDRMGTSGGSTSLRYSSGWASNKFQQGRLTTRACIPSVSPASRGRQWTLGNRWQPGHIREIIFTRVHQYVTAGRVHPRVFAGILAIQEWAHSGG